MRWSSILLVVFLVALVGCGDPSGDDDDDDNNDDNQSPSPSESVTPPGNFDYDMDATNFDLHDNLIAAVRILDGSTQIACGNDQTVMNGVFAYSFTAVLEDGTTYTIEVFAKIEAGNTYDDTLDTSWSWTITPTANTSETLDFNDTQGVITWTPGSGC